jgi:hypothetical protein
LPITIVGTAQLKASGAAAGGLRTLDCSASSADFTSPPQPGDWVGVQAWESDDSGLSTLNAPAGFTSIGTYAVTTLAHRANYRQILAGDGTFNWQIPFNGQTGWVCILHAVILRGAWQGVLNPTGLDPSWFRSLNQAFATTQNTPSITQTQNGSAIIGGWGRDTNIPAYSGINALNGVATSVALLDTHIAPGMSASLAVATAVWLDPRPSALPGQATMPAGGLSLYDSSKFGVKIAAALPQTMNPNQAVNRAGTY